MPESTLTLEQQFQLRAFETQVDRMSHDQAKMFCVKLYEQNMALKQLVAHQWGIDNKGQFTLGQDDEQG